MLDFQPCLGGVTVTRHVHQAVAETPIGVETQEQPQPIAFLDLHDGDGVFEQLVDRRLEQLVTRQHLENLHQLLGQMRGAAEIGALHDRLDLAADERDASHALGVDRRGEQAEEAAFANHPPLVIEFTHRDEVRVSRTVHAAGHGRLGERQQQRLTQVADRLAGERLLLLGKPGAHAARQTQQRAFVIDDAAALGLFLHGELFVAEEGEVVVRQPAHEVADLVQLVAIDAQVDLLQTPLQLDRLALHRRKVTHHLTHISQHTQQ